MYVRKFESETMNGAISQIKKELGPDAIILKTRTNKGFKGAFKKNRIEITAAISEKNYSKKTKIDHIFDEHEKKKFYKNNSSYISDVIENYENINSSKKQIKTNSSNDLKKEPTSDLDQFLENKEKSDVEQKMLHKKSYHLEQDSSFLEKNLSVDRQTKNDQKDRIDDLEKKVFQLENYLSELRKDSPFGILQLQTTLRSLGINESYVQRISKKILFGLSKEDLKNVDIIFEFALKEMLNKINVAFPLFSNVEDSKNPVVTVLISEISCGQTTILYKLGALKEESILIRLKGKLAFTENIFSLQVKEAKTLPNYVSFARHAVEKGQSVFMDYKSMPQNSGETKRFIDGLRRSFDKVEVLICLSSICSEAYNKKIIERYTSLSDGLIVTKLDLCLDYGSLFNIGEKYRQLPFKFFGTGEVIPEDIEAATAERILSGIFQLK